MGKRKVDARQACKGLGLLMTNERPYEGPEVKGPAVHGFRVAAGASRGQS